MASQTDQSKDHDDRSHAAMLQWLSSLNYKENMDSLLKKRLPGTSDWILESQELKDWISGSGKSSILWFYALSGIGRSTLVSVITEHPEREVTRPGEALAYIFTTYGVVFSVLDILLSICKQLAAQCSQLPWQLVKMYSQMAQAGSHPDIDELMLLTVSMCDSFSRVFILIDDLSEISRDSDRSILIPKLQWLRNHGAKILVSSGTHGDRPEPCGCTRDIEDACAGEAELLLLPHEGDMRAFISHEMHKNGEWETVGITGCRHKVSIQWLYSVYLQR
jgi:hypothetical protein